MKNIKIGLLITFAFLTNVSFSQSTQAVRGTVLDKEAGYPMIGVNVLLITNHETIGTTTDIDGKFILPDVPLGRQALQFSYIGYKPVTKPNLLVNAGKQLAIEVLMEEDLNKMEEVVIVANKNTRKAVNDMAVLSARSMSMEEVGRFSGSMGDVSRMAQNYAGVSGASDNRNDIIVRGNSPSTVLWRMEGVDIPSPNHWSTLGTSGGPISMLNSNNLRTSDFLSSAFPAEYGNAVGAVFDLNLRNGNQDKYEFLGQIGFNGFELGAEGPLKFVGKNASFLVNYRYSTLGVFDALGIDFGTGGSVPQYQDANFKINIPTSKAGRFSLWGLTGKSKIVFEPELEGNLFSDGDEKLESGAKTFIGGLSHLYFFNNRTSSTVSLSYSATESTVTQEELIDIDNSIFEKQFTSRNYQEKIGLNVTINSKINASNRIKAGFIGDFYNLNVKDSVLLDDPELWFKSLDFEGNTNLYRAFGQWQYKPNNSLTTNIGLHTSLLSLNDSYSIEPRASVSYELSEKATVGIGYGRHSQLQPLPIYFSKDRDATPDQNAANEELELIKSDHYVASLDYQITPLFGMKVEAYYQSLFDLAVDPLDGGFSMVNFGADFGFPNRVGLVNEGTASNLGLELTLERSLKEGFYFLTTASIFDSKYKGFDKKEYNTFFNSNYVVNVLIGKEIKLNKKMVMTLDARFNYAGGRRYTPFDIAASTAAGEGILDESNIYGEQYDPYMRPDFKIGIRMNGKKTTQVWFVDLQNFIFRKNVFFYNWDEVNNEIDVNYQRGFFPNINYQILF